MALDRDDEYDEELGLCNASDDGFRFLWKLFRGPELYTSGDTDTDNVYHIRIRFVSYVLSRAAITICYPLWWPYGATGKRQEHGNW